MRGEILFEQIVKILVPILSALLAMVSAVYYIRKLSSTQKRFEQSLEESKQQLATIALPDVDRNDG